MAVQRIDSIENFTPIQDRIRLYLGSFGNKEIPITIEQLSSQLRLTSTQVYQGIKRLQDRGEISLDKETLPNSSAERIIGINLIKLEPSSRTYRRSADKAKTIYKYFPKPAGIPTPESSPAFPQIMEYLNKKLTIEELREHAISGGLDANIIQFEINEIAEEAIALLKIVSEYKEQIDSLARENQLLRFDLEAEKRNVETYKSRLRDETQEELRNYARAN